MDLLKERLDIARIIAEELTGTVNDCDRDVLTRWLEEDERHGEEYEKLRELLRSGEGARQDQERGRQLLESRWGAVKSRTMRKRTRWLTWSRYAAVILLPLLAVIFWFVRGDRPGDVAALAVSPIEHGSTKARLELADGRRVELDEKVHFQLEEAGGARILTADKMVKYMAGDALEQVAVEEKYNTLTVPRGGEFTLELADGTRVWLNAESSLRYPVHFVGDERKVEMTGEVYFEVAKNKEKPFVVAVNGVDIRVLGTSFNVSAYRDKVVTTLVEGKVQLEKEGKRVVLSPDQQGIWVGRDFEVKSVDARNYALWKEGIFYFEDVDLETILDDMARWYNVNVFYVSPALKSKKFSVEIKRYENINEILRRIEQTKRVKFEIKDRTINVYQ